jgi:hypothetical protein
VVPPDIPVGSLGEDPAGLPPVPVCASANVLDRAKAVASAIVVSFIVVAETT